MYCDSFYLVDWMQVVSHNLDNSCAFSPDFTHEIHFPRTLACFVPCPSCSVEAFLAHVPSDYHSHRLLHLVCLFNSASYVCERSTQVQVVPVSAVH